MPISSTSSPTAIAPCTGVGLAFRLSLIANTQPTKSAVPTT